MQNLRLPHHNNESATLGHGDKILSSADINRLTKAARDFDECFARANRVFRSVSSVSDLSPEEQALHTRLLETFQDYAAMLGIDDSNAATMPMNNDASAQPQFVAPTIPTPRRSSTKCFDALILCGVSQAELHDHVAGQQNLFELGQALDDRTKRASVIAKLNRWKSEKLWLKWDKPEIITLTDLGKYELGQHMKIVKTKNELDLIRNAVQTAWGYTPKL